MGPRDFIQQTVIYKKMYQMRDDEFVDKKTIEWEYVHRTKPDELNV